MNSGETHTHKRTNDMQLHSSSFLFAICLYKSEVKATMRRKQ